MEADAYTVTGVAVNDLSSDHRCTRLQRNSQRQGGSFGDVHVRAHVESAQADVLGTRYAGGILTIEMYVNNQPRPIELPPFVGGRARPVQFVVNQGDASPLRKTFQPGQ